MGAQPNARAGGSGPVQNKSGGRGDSVPGSMARTGLRCAPGSLPRQKDCRHSREGHLATRVGNGLRISLTGEAPKEKIS